MEVIVADPNFAPMYAHRNRKIEPGDARTLDQSDCHGDHWGTRRRSKLLAWTPSSRKVLRLAGTERTSRSRPLRSGGRWGR